MASEIVLALSGQISDPIAVGPGARVTVRGSGWIEWTTASLVDVGNGLAQWQPWPRGQSAGFADTLRRVVIRARATGPLVVDVDESRRDEGAESAYWQDATPAWLTDANGNLLGLDGPSGFLEANASSMMASRFAVDVTADEIRTAVLSPQAWTGSGWRLPGEAAAVLAGDASSSVAMQVRRDGNVEFKAHNLVWHSEAFDNAAWTKASGAAVIADAGVAPDGSLTADLLYPTVSASLRALFQGTNNSTVVSVYAKAAGATTLSVIDQAGATYIATFNVATGVIVSSGAGVTSSIENVGDGWYRCIVRSTTGAPFLLAQFGTVVASQTGTLGILLWGAQGNVGPAATAYIPTGAASRFAPAIDWLVSANRYALRSEPAGTNRVLWARDLTQAAWTRTNATATRTATGVDGDENSASVLTATAANATALQAITDTSRERTLSMYLRRRTGTGTVETTIDGGTTWVPRTLTAAWQRFRTTVTSANPSVGVRIVVSGDAVDVDIVQEENGPRDTSPIITGSTTVTRAEDTLSAPYAFGTAATLVVEYVPAIAGSQTILALDDGTSNERILLSNDGVLTVTDGGVAQATPDGGTPVVGAVNRIAARVAPNDFGVSLNGGAVATDVSGTVPTTTTLRFGVAANAHILRVRVRGNAPDVLQSLSAS